MRNFKLVILVIFAFSSCIAYSQDLKVKKYKSILPNYIGIDSNIILTECDSMIFHGFMILGFSRHDCQNESKDSDFIKMDLFFVNNLEDLSKTTARYYYSSDYEWYLAQYLLSEEPIKIVADTENGDSLVTNNNFDEKLKVLKSEDFQHFKSLYSKYYRKSEKKGMFFEKDLTCKILDNPNVLFVNHNDCDSIGYYIFQCSFPTSVLNFNAYCIKGGNNEEGKKNIEKMGFLRVLMPIDSFITFKTIDVKVLELHNLKKSIWLPPIK